MPSKRDLILDIVQFSLDIAGIVDPTGTADAASGLMSLARGRWLDAAISGVSMLPYIGDVAKLGKLPRYAKSIADAVALAVRDCKFANELRPALQRLKDALDKVPLHSLPASAQAHIRRIKSDLDAFLKRRMYHPNPKHELGGARGVKGTRLDLTADEAYELLNDSRRCLEVPGRKQLVAVSKGRIYVFQPDGVGGFHAYPSSGKEIAARYSTVAPKIAEMLKVDIKRLSRME